MNKHWTESNHEDYQFMMADEFLEQVLIKMDELKITQKEVAENWELPKVEFHSC